MGTFRLVFRHYLKRTFMHKANLLAMLLLPTAIILFFAFVNDHQASEQGISQLFYGYNVVHTGLVVGNIFFFQLFGAFNNLENLHELMTTQNKWRLWSAPVNRSVFPLAIMLASWIVSIIQALIVLFVTTFILNVYWGNHLVNVFVLLSLSLFAQALGVLIFSVTKSSTQGNAIAYPLTFFMGGLSGFVIPIQQLVNHSIIDFLGDWSPLTLASRAVAEAGRFGVINLAEGVYTGGDMSIAIRNILIIAAMATVLAVVSYAIGKVRKVW